MAKFGRLYLNKEEWQSNLFPAYEDAKRLKEQTFTLAEFLEKKAPDLKVPELKRKAIVHGTVIIRR